MKRRAEAGQQDEAGSVAAPPAPRPPSDGRRIVQSGSWWECGWFHLLLLFAVSIPLLYPTIPPLVDMPGHLGQYRVELDHDTVPALRRYFAVEWKLIGNLGVDLLVIPLSAVFGLEPAAKLVVILIPVLHTLGLLWICKELHRKIPPAILFALPLAYGQPFIYGFVNFTLAEALVLNGFALWLRLGRLGRVRERGLLFPGLSSILWVCHAYGWAMLLLCIWVAEFVQALDGGQAWAASFVRAGRRSLPLAPPVVLMILWRSNPDGSLAFGYSWLDKLQWWAMCLRDRWAPFDIASAIFLFGAYAALVRMRQVAVDPMARAVSAALLAVYVAMPAVIFGGSYGDMRLIPTIIGFAFLSLGPIRSDDRRTARLIAACGLAFFLVRLGGTALSFSLTDSEYNADLAALEHIAPGARIASFVGHPCRSGWNPNKFDHLPSMAIIRKAGFTNDQWDVGGAQIVRPIYPGGPSARYRSDPHQLVTPRQCGSTWSLDAALETLPRGAFDYLWLINPPPFDPAKLKGATKVWENRSSALFGLSEDHSSPAGIPNSPM